VNYCARLNGDSVLCPVVGGDRLPQWRDPERVGVADPLARQRAPGSLEHRLGCRAPRLADFEMDHVGAGSLALVGGTQHVHRDERRHEPPPGHPQGHARAHPSGFDTRRVAAG
jgi:hypothetical protein